MHSYGNDLEQDCAWRQRHLRNYRHIQFDPPDRSVRAPSIAVHHVISNEKGFQLRVLRRCHRCGYLPWHPAFSWCANTTDGDGLLGRDFFQNHFLPYFGPLSLIALLYTIIIIFAEQAQHILDNLGPVFRNLRPSGALLLH